MKIRKAVCADATGIATVHIKSWQSSYKNIVPDEILANLSLERRLQHWSQTLCASNPTVTNNEFVFVAENETGAVVGFASGGPERTSDALYDGELYAIYLLENYQGQGLGKKLFRAVMRQLAAQNYNNMLLWVFTDNQPSWRFYEGQGGQELRSQQFELGGQNLSETGYGWQNIADLVKSFD